jgi:hypothetical protein
MLASMDYVPLKKVEDLDGILRDESGYDPNYWFNCHRAHLMDHIPMEASWVDDRQPSVSNKLRIEESELHPDNLKRFYWFRKEIQYAESRGNVSWRDDRESHTKRGEV